MKSSSIWDIYIWAYTTMNDDERQFLSPLFHVNTDDGYWTIRPNQGEGQQSLISARPRLLLSNAFGIKKFRYVAYRHMPAKVIKDGVGVFPICVYERQKKRERLDPENLGKQMGIQYGKEYRELYQKRLTSSTNKTRERRTTLGKECKEFIVPPWSEANHRRHAKRQCMLQVLIPTRWFTEKTGRCSRFQSPFWGAMEFSLHSKVQHAPYYAHS